MEEPEQLDDLRMKRRPLEEGFLSERRRDEVLEVVEELEVALLLREERRVEVDFGAERRLGREDEVLLVVRELAGEKADEDLEDRLEEVLFVDEVSRDGRDGEDLDAEEDERVLGLAVGQKVGFGETRVDLGVLFACE